MKAAWYERYGDAGVLRIREVERPAAKDGEVLVEIVATTVTTADWRLRASAFPGAFWLPGRLMFGLFAPRNRILGSEFAGRVVALGSKVTKFAEGDEVFGFAMHGAHAQYLAISQDAAIAKKPANIDFDEAAAMPFGALSALVFLRDFAKVARGQSVLVHGASGGVGVHAVQLACHFGATVTGVCSTANRDLVASLGADYLIDYTQEDFTEADRACDVVFDTIGKTSFSKVRRVLKPTGIFLPLEFGLREMVQSLATRLTGGKRVVIGVSGDTQQDLAYVAALLEKGEIRPVIDARYQLEQIADAHRRVESRHKRGSVVVMVGDGARPEQA